MPPADRAARRVRRALLLLPTLVVLLAVGGTALLAASLQERAIREAAAERVLQVASSLAGLREVRAALADAVDAGRPGALADAAALAPATEALQPLADLAEGTSGVYYVVITDDEGVRITHPDERERGVQVSTTNASVLAGEPFVGTETGASGPSLRAKLPVQGDDGRVVGMVAVGVLESSLSDDRDAALGQLLPWALGALVVGTLASSAIAAAVERRLRRADDLAAEHEQTRRIAGALREQSHEFGTRLHVVHGLVSAGAAQDALDYIDGIVPVLALEREDQGGRTTALAAAVQGLRAELVATGTHLALEAEDGLEVDEDVLLCIANLCRNAAEAGAGRVRCAVEQHGDRLRAVVDDDGPGIAPQDAERVFERGRSTKADPSGLGRGIGLDLVRRVVTARDGAVTLSRSPLGGARFELEMDAR